MRLVPIALAITGLASGLLRGRDAQPARGHADWSGVQRALAGQGMERFGHVYVLNLPSDKDRLTRMQRVMRGLVPHFEVFRATDGNDPAQVTRKQLAALHRAGKGHKCGPAEVTDMSESNAKRPWAPHAREGTLGCYMTHLRLLKDAMAKGYESVLIFEDDLAPRADAPGRLSSATALPASWDMLYLGYHYHQRPTTYVGPIEEGDCRAVNPELCRLEYPVLEQTHALAVHQRAYAPLIHLLEQALQDKTACPVDQMYRAFFAEHPALQVYAARSTLFEQLSAEKKMVSHIRAADDKY